MSDLNSARELIESRIEAFVALFAVGCSRPTLAELAAALDELTSAYFATPDVEPHSTDATRAPNIDERAFSERAAEIFPDLKWFCTVEPDGEVEQSVGLSDACGDLAEIANDLDHVVWEFREGSISDGIWEFRFGYQTHWGRHLHELRTYLHTLAAW